jgi:hypothetical protein
VRDRNGRSHPRRRRCSGPGPSPSPRGSVMRRVARIRIRLLRVRSAESVRPRLHAPSVRGRVASISSGLNRIPAYQRALPRGAPAEILAEIAASRVEVARGDTSSRLHAALPGGEDPRSSERRPYWTTASPPGDFVRGRRPRKPGPEIEVRP